MGVPMVGITGRIRRAASGGLAVVCLQWANCPVLLADSKPAPTFSLQVSPTRLVVPAGTTATSQHFQLTNGGRSPFVVTVEKADFTADVHGALRFRPNAPYAASNWVEVQPTSFRMAPGTTKDVSVRINVPGMSEPGDHQLAVLFKVPAGRNGANIRINRVVAAPVLIAVPGSIDDSVAIAGLHAPGFVMGGPVPITTTIRSVGTIHRDFRGVRRLRVRVGGDNVQFPDFTVLRGLDREVTARWNPPLICVCHATVSITGPGGTKRAATVRIVVLPLDLLAIILAVVLALLNLGWYLRRRYRAKVLAAAAALNAREDGLDA